ncbi:MAG: T9SS type A sorting domain-containing protein [Bacteroidales bacterium]|nr:T9SS type A sorting domain-containing protein [Bacteroidales bacterium]
MKTKKTLLIAITLVTLLSTKVVNAQIYMNTAGDVNIGAPYSYPCKLRVVGWTNIRGSFTIGGNYYSNLGMSVEGGAYFLTGIGSNYGVGVGLYPDAVNTLKVAGSESGYAIRAYGNSYSTGSWITSDKRFKKNFKPITGALEKIQKLNGQRYEFKSAKELKGLSYNNNVTDTVYRFDNDGKKSAMSIPSASYVLPQGEQIGLLAQDVMETYPELAKQDPSDGTYSINYDGFIPLLIEAIKEQQVTIEKYEKRLSVLENKELKNTEKTIEQYNQPYIEQNAPNPFSVSTTINTYIPQNSQKAAIYIYDMQGLQKKTYNIISKGKSAITINDAELPAGMYFYTLIVDGKEVDTKRMILTN